MRKKSILSNLLVIVLSTVGFWFFFDFLAKYAFGKAFLQVQDIRRTLPMFAAIILQALISFNIFRIFFYTMLSFWGIGKCRRPYELVPAKRTFQIIIPAKNEGTVIEQTVERLLKVNYPSKKVQITIIADNCDDNTVELLAKYPVNVFENHSAPEDPKGKPHAIRKYLETQQEWQKCDYLIILDADNIMDENYLLEMNSQFLASPELTCIQGYLGVKNPSSSILASGYAAAYFNSNRFYQLAKSRLNWNTTIGGTGFALSTDYIKEHGWNPISYTEDFELQVELSLQGKKSTWNHLAVVYDEKPNQLKVSNKQRIRWAQGHWRIALSTSLKQLASLFKSRSLTEFMSKVETFLYSYTMLSSILFVLTLVFFAVNPLNFVYLLFPVGLFFPWIVLDCYRFIILNLASILTEGKHYIQQKNSIFQKIIFVVRLFFSLFWASITYIYPQVRGLLTCWKKQNAWVKTKHTETFHD